MKTDELIRKYKWRNVLHAIEATNSYDADVVERYMCKAHEFYKNRFIELTRFDR